MRSPLSKKLVELAAAPEGVNSRHPELRAMANSTKICTAANNLTFYRRLFKVKLSHFDTRYFNSESAVKEFLSAERESFGYERNNLKLNKNKPPLTKTPKAKPIPEVWVHKKNKVAIKEKKPDISYWRRAPAIQNTLSAKEAIKKFTPGDDMIIKDTTVFTQCPSHLPRSQEHVFTFVHGGLRCA